MTTDSQQPSPEQQAEDAAQLEVFTKVAEVLRSIPGADGSVHLFRRSGKDARTGKLEFLTDVDADSFSLSGVQDSWGGGYYAARPYIPGKGYMPGQVSFLVSGDPKWPEEPDTTAPEPWAGPAGPGGAGKPAWLIELEAKLERIEESRRDDALVRMMEVQSQNQSAILGPLLAAVMNREPSPVGEMMTLFREGLNLGKEASSDGYGTIATQVAAPLLEAIRLGAPSRQAALPNPEAAREDRGPTASAPAPDPSTLPPWARLLAPHIELLDQIAAARGDVEHWSSQIVENTPDEVVLALLDAMADQAAFRAELHRIFPSTAPHQEWYREFVAAFTTAAEAAFEDVPDEPEPDDERVTDDDNGEAGPPDREPGPEDAARGQDGGPGDPGARRPGGKPGGDARGD